MMQNTNLLLADVGGLVEELWGEEVVGMGLCNAADMVAELDPSQQEVSRQPSKRFGRSFAALRRR